MSQVVDRNKVFKSTRVRTSLKNDECWIQRAKQEKKEEELASTDQAVESRPSTVRLSSYVLSTVKRFEAVDSPPSTTLQMAPSEGDSANHANGEVNPQKDAQPEGSTVGSTDDAKNQAPTEELNVEAQGIPEAVSDVKTAEQSVANGTAEIKEDQADATIEQPKIELAEPRVATDAPSEDTAAETSAAARTEESKGITEVPEAPVVKLAAEVVEAVAEDVENEALAEAAVKSPIDGPAVTDAAGEGSQEPAAVEVVEVVAEATVESSPEAAAVTDAAGEESVTQVSVKTDLVAESISEVPAQSAAEPEQAAVEVVETVTEVSPSDTSDVVNATPGEVAAVQDIVEAVVEVAVESSPETPAVTIVAGTEAPLQVRVEQVPDVVADAVSESPTKAETAVKSVECEVKSAPLAETVTELHIEDALLEPVPALEDVQDKSTDSPVEQSKVLDVEHPKTEAAPEPQDDQNQNSYEAIRKTNVCSYCDKFIDGNVKLFLNEPVMICHPDCLKCGVCAMALGDLLTAIFLHGQVIHCGGCFHKILVI
ncbi:hypothetical protein CesoFtcFv8_016494 [Champsocephalus esox]|uniref:LIM zinc-binding domain-containing protein n=1 Tax=Champsocephalus esox TaxID=159716 RepID=A0AAN8BPX7_9TELE|nr:hypothetical protein CesoFtcFv8_016494 [Champsocephalus esox]